MTFRAQKLEMVFALGTLDVSDVAARALAALELGEEVVQLYGQRGRPADVISRIKADKRPAFKIATSEHSVHFASANAYKVHLLEFREEKGSQARDWDAIAERFLAEAGFVQACVSDVEHSFWQNARDPLQYQAAGRSYSALAMVSNGLPPPLTQRVIDVSGNAARRVLRVGYVEMIGHLMWLGPKFWPYVGENRRKAILGSANCRVTELSNGILRVAAIDGPFVDDHTQTEQAELRRLILG